MIISLIVALSQNRVIGREGEIPWRLPQDLKLFKQNTMGHCILMGRKTFESIGRPLPGRPNLVLTRNPQWNAEGCTRIASLEEGIAWAQALPETELFIIGGGEIYRMALNQAQRIYLSEVKTKLDGDTYFPVLSKEDWEEVNRTSYFSDEKNQYDFDFVVLERSNTPPGKKT